MLLHAHFLHCNMTTSISVVIPTHNRPDGLTNAVQSVCRQTVLPAELIVVDDGSSQPIREDIFDAAPAGLKTVLLRNEEPHGAPHARNRGIREATSEWIAFLDDDDVFVTSKIERISKAIQGTSKADIWYHSADIHLTREKVTYRSGVKAVSSGLELYKELLVKNLIGGTSMVVAKKQVLEEAGGFDIRMPALQDWELWIRLAEHNKQFCYLDEVLVHYFFNTNKESISRHHDKMLKAYEMIASKNESGYANLSGEQQKEYKINKLNNLIIKDLLNYSRVDAFKRQMEKYLLSRSWQDLVMILIIPFGVKWVYKLRALMK